MSVQAMSYVIDHSKHKGGAFLCLLMIANHADRFGCNAFPGVAMLAAECRMSEREIYNIIPALTASGELEIPRRGRGRGKLTEFRVVMEGKGEIISPFKSVDKSAEKVKSATGKGEICDTEKVKSATGKGEICDTADSAIGDRHIISRARARLLQEPLTNLKLTVEEGDARKARPVNNSEKFWEVSDRIYNSDPTRFDRLISWIRDQQAAYKKLGKSELGARVILRSLTELEKRAPTVSGSWWAYLTTIAKRVHSEEMQAEAGQYREDMSLKAALRKALL